MSINCTSYFSSSTGAKGTLRYSSNLANLHTTFFFIAVNIEVARHLIRYAVKRSN